MAGKSRNQTLGAGRAYCYLRVSKSHQALSGLGLQAQRQSCMRRARMLGFEMGTEWNCLKRLFEPQPGFFVDAGESAFRLPLRKRDAGAALLAVVKRGDVIVTSRMDRMFRSVVDFCHVSTELEARGVRLVIDSPQIDLGTANGRAFAHMLATFAEWESARKGERISAALRVKRELLANQKVKQVKDTGKGTLASDWRPANFTTVQEGEKPDDVFAKSEGKPGRIFIYMRCSHVDSAKSGLGLIEQANLAQRYAEGLMEKNPNLVMCDSFTDLATSAIELPLRERFSGKRLDEGLQDGDYVIISCLDRGFRNIQDVATTLPDWQKRGVDVHFVTEGIAASDPTGALMIHVMSLFAQYEGEIIRERNREMKKQAQAEGKYCGGSEPSFWKIHYPPGHNRLKRRKKKLILDPDRLKHYRTLLMIIKYRGVTIAKALEILEQQIAERQHREPIPPGGIWRRSVKNRQLGKDYPRDRKGRAFPWFTKRAYDRCRPQYANAMEAYLKRIAQSAKIRREIEAKKAEEERQNQATFSLICDVQQP